MELAPYLEFDFAIGGDQPSPIRVHFSATEGTGDQRQINIDRVESLAEDQIIEITKDLLGPQLEAIEQIILDKTGVNV